MEKHEIFRKSSLDRLSSPEQLDTLARVVTPVGWLALLTLGVFIAAALIWGWGSTIPVVVRGEGMLLNHGGIMNVVTLNTGQVKEIFVRPNDFIKEGDVVASIFQPVADNELLNARNELADLRQQHDNLLEFAARNQKYQTESWRIQMDSINRSIKSQELRLKFLELQKNKMHARLEQGTAIIDEIEEKQHEIDSLLEQIETNRAHLADLKVQEHAYNNRNADSIRQSASKIHALERTIALMKKKLEFDSLVTSKFTGKVLEIKTSPGTVINVGSPVVSAELTEKKLEAVIYVPESEGKKIKPGMTVDIVPTPVKKEEYGSIRGRVTFVSEHPASSVGMLTVLGNEQLVQEILKKGTPYAVRAELIRDRASPSGYKWSSGGGPTIPIVSGTLCTGDVIAGYIQPLHLVIPSLRKSVRYN